LAGSKKSNAQARKENMRTCFNHEVGQR